MIATTCFVLGTLAVIYGGGRGSSSSSNSNNNRTVGLSDALLFGRTGTGTNTAAGEDDDHIRTPVYPVWPDPYDNDDAQKVYNPFSDNCYKDKYTAYKWCWCPVHSFPCGSTDDENWEQDWEAVPKKKQKYCGDRCGCWW